MVFCWQLLLGSCKLKEDTFHLLDRLSTLSAQDISHPLATAHVTGARDAVGQMKTGHRHRDCLVFKTNNTHSPVPVLLGITTQVFFGWGFHHRGRISSDCLPGSNYRAIDMTAVSDRVGGNVDD